MSYTPPPPPPPGGGYGYAAPQTSQKAVWALVTGIISILCCAPVGIVAIWLGRSAEREIAASGGAQTGGGMAKAGWVLGVIGLVLLVLGAILYGAGVLTYNFNVGTGNS